MNLPNKITIFRILLVFFFMPFLFLHGLIPKITALILFLIAVLSDYLDGFIARKYDLVSDLGKIMDPVADKILVLAAFIAFVELKLIPAWMVVIILSREMAVTSLRLVAFKKEEVISASTAGKHKTVSQMFSILLILVFITVKETGSKDLMGFWSVSLDHLYRNVIFFTMLITVTLTVISGIQYFYNNKKVFFPHDQNT